MNDGDQRLPDDFDENPEWTEADFAAARVGAPWLWNEQACTRLREALATLEPAEAVTRAGIEHAAAKIREALADLEPSN